MPTQVNSSELGQLRARDSLADHDSIAALLGGRLTASTRLLGGTSTQSHRLDIALDTDQLVVVTRQFHRNENDESTGVAQREHDVLVALHAASIPVPKPYLVADDGNVVVAEFVSGSPDVGTAELSSALDQMADTLVNIHAVDPTTIESLLPLEDPVTELPAYLPDNEVGRLVASALGEVDVSPNPAVVAHGDYWPGNVLWRDGQLVAVIDWEDVCVGDPLADLACARVELLCAYGEAAMEQFTERYLDGVRNAQAASIDTTDLSLWESYVSATALAHMHEWGLSADDEARRRATTTAFFERAARALG